MWTTTTIDNGQSAIRKAYFSFGSGELQRVCNLVFKTRCHFLWCPTMQLSVIFYTLLNGIFTCLYRCLYRGFILTIFFLIVSHFLLCNCPLFFLLCSMAYLHAFMPGHFFPINSWRYSLNSFSSPSVHWIRVTIKEIWKQILKNFMQRKKLIHKLSILKRVITFLGNVWPRNHTIVILIIMQC